MKKVGIVTLVGGDNYGNALQNYAVQTLLEQAGYNAFTLNNRTQRGFPYEAVPELPLYKKLMPSHIISYLRVQIGNRYGSKNDRDFTVINLFRSKRQNEAYLQAKRSRSEKFADFRSEYICQDDTPIDNFSFSRKHFAEYFAFICGSDQVWNPYYRTVSMIDFLQFAPEHKRIALAPSFGVSDIPVARHDDYRAWLSAIPHLSVREYAGADIIKKLTGRVAEVLLDPTFALTRKHWLEFAREPQIHPDKQYVFCYFLGNETRRYVHWIKNYAKENNCQIVDVCDIQALGYYDIAPREFVWLLANAQAVFTDSFHGIALSINLKVPFLAFERVEGGSSMSSRIESVLKKTGLEERRFPNIKADKVKSVDFYAADRAIKLEREKTCGYLARALSSAEQGRIPLLANRYHCTGCNACLNICPTGALQMEADKEGFFYPTINSAKCVQCKDCENVCPADAVRPEDKLPLVYLAYSRDKQICADSSSGGIFSHLARKIIEQGGVVFGAGFDDNFSVCHMLVENITDIWKLRTSKYVQSDIGFTFCTVRNILQSGKQVLFTGTPCQIAALKQFLVKSYDNLYLQDFICHGVPSPYVWEQYLKQNHGEKPISAISFRDKTQGWNNFSMKVLSADGSCYCQTATTDPFERAFLANLSLRPVCYQCQYKTISRVSDITLADYWGVEVVHPELKEQQGVSLVLLHSEKGERLFKSISDDIYFGKTDAERALKMNHAAEHSVNWHPMRNYFFAEIAKLSFIQLVQKCLKPTKHQNIRLFIVKSGSRVKRILRKIKER